MQLIFANDLFDLKILSQKSYLGCHRTTKRRRDNEKITFSWVTPDLFRCWGALLWVKLNNVFWLDRKLSYTDCCRRSNAASTTAINIRRFLPLSKVHTVRDKSGNLSANFTRWRNWGICKSLTKRMNVTTGSEFKSSRQLCNFPPCFWGVIIGPYALSSLESQ